MDLKTTFFMSPLSQRRRKLVTQDHFLFLHGGGHIHETSCSYLLQADDALSRVSLGGDGERVCPLGVNDAVLDVCIDAKVLVVGFDLPHRFPHLSRFRDVQLVILCGGETTKKSHLRDARGNT